MDATLDFALGETADMIRDTTRRFASERIAPLAAKIDARARKVMATLIDVDLRRVTHALGLDTGPLANVAMVGADWFGGPFLAKVLTKKAETVIDQALEQVREAFRPNGAGAP